MHSVHTLNPGCAHGAPKLHAVRPGRAHRAVSWHGVVAQHRPCRSLAWPCRRPRRPYRGLVSRAPARIACLLQVTIQNLYRNLGPCHLSYRSPGCVVSRHSQQSYLSAPLSRYNQLYSDTPTTSCPLVTPTTRLSACHAHN